MTNREWLMNLSDEELAKVIDANGCDYCAYYINCERHCPMGETNGCIIGIEKWLNAKHEIPMPELKIGDIVNVKISDMSFEINGTIVSKNVVLLSEGFGCQSFKGNIESLCTEIKRYNELKGEMEVIWRADNGIE